MLIVLWASSDCQDLYRQYLSRTSLRLRRWMKAKCFYLKRSHAKLDCVTLNGYRPPLIFHKIDLGGGGNGGSEVNFYRVCCLARCLINSQDQISALLGGHQGAHDHIGI